MLNFLAVSLNNFVLFLQRSALVLLLVHKIQSHLNVLIMYIHLHSFYIAPMQVSYIEK